MKRRTFGGAIVGLPLAPLLAAGAMAPAAAPDPPGAPVMGGSIADVPGIVVGHHTLSRRPTGCTVLLCGDGAVAGVDVRGSAPGTRETDLLDPTNLVQKVQAVLLSGGSAFGLEAATGVMRYLEERRLGFPVRTGVVPIVPAAILFDLGLGDFAIRPDAEAGYQACMAAGSGPVREGNVGAGAGASVGKMFGPAFAMKGGLGTASHRVPGTEVVVGALVAVNALGDVRHPRTGEILAGARAENGRGFRDTMAAVMNGHRVVVAAGANTTIGAVATNVPFTKAEATKIAQMAQDGLARAIHPVHTMSDGDTIFALSTGKAAGVRADVSAVRNRRRRDGARGGPSGGGGGQPARARAARPPRLRPKVTQGWPAC
jgi:L-aminopeptidase/D-esterase-like protein